MDLAGKLKRSKDALNDQKLKMDELCAKLSKLSIRNVNKKLKRRDNKIKKSMLHGQLKKEIEDKCATIAQVENIGLCQHSKEKNVIAARLINMLRQAVYLKLLMMKFSINLLDLKKSISLKLMVLKMK